ncbi:MAG TPA: acylphosphatase [Casimicrobiaceae bacterium]|nr:acylphosphatase [Casimicrobiaceae bacterium]
MTIARRVVVSGRVQGVGFRESLVHLARRVGLVGWVRNVRDGTVEALLQGDERAVEHLIAWCRQGPPAAQVTQLEVSSRDVDDTIADFSRRATM